MENNTNLLDKNVSIFPIPMNNDSEYQRLLETAEPLEEKELKEVENEYGFTYRQGIGEILYALVTCRMDISYALIKLSQYSVKPARIHFEAVAQLYRYLYATREDGIYYWRNKPRLDLEDHAFPKCKFDPMIEKDSKNPLIQIRPEKLEGLVDSDFAGDRQHRKSVTGVTLKLAGGAIIGKTRFQEIIAQSSTEAEFIAAADAGKMILYVRSILEQVGICQEEATVLYEDNQGALLMAQAGQPTKKTRHVDIKHFSIQQWTEMDIIALNYIKTTFNSSDAMTKALGRTLFYRHMDYIMGRKIPEYVMYVLQKCDKDKFLEISTVTKNTPHTQACDALSKSEGG